MHLTTSYISYYPHIHTIPLSIAMLHIISDILLCLLILLHVVHLPNPSPWTSHIESASKEWLERVCSFVDLGQNPTNCVSVCNGSVDRLVLTRDL